MTQRVILIHGWGGTHEQHWMHWLKQELEKEKIKVLFPLMPNPDYPKLEEWLQTLKKLIEDSDEKIILIGHSLGVPTILRYLEQLPKGKQIHHAILVAGFARPLKVKEIDEFVQEPFDWKKIRQNAKRFTVIFSDNDSKVPRYQAEFVAESLRVKPIIEPNAGHITSPQFGPYPGMLELVTKK